MQPTAAEVRAAAEAVKAALDRHLAAVERRSGDDDPAVYEAFNQVAAAAEAYDELLYDRYDEVTPFEIPAAEDELPPYTGPEEPNALSVLIRRDYAVVEPQRLLAQARRVEAADDDRASGTGASGTVHGALGLLFGEFEPDEVASRHKEFGLEEGDSTLWVTAADEPAEAGEWLEAPFEHVDPQRVVCRFDVSAVFDDDADDDFDDDLDDEAGDVEDVVDQVDDEMVELDTDVDEADEAGEEELDEDDELERLDADR
ncbi:hypothetical protein GCM10010259_63180 [Streptomyces daghestanicus]|uniref:DNA primase n=2 Tax=Streptomyces TaxID=1883 RepID=A0A918GI85_STRGD|nr:hypothetical protein GCM10010238_24590 [Streptomyces niveoruber]GGS96995.1 hypothetical protein GCM10010240_32850 [Streptomyces griseoviridis]GGU64134.1 hypothetical protein GCM10010259_63180 [Streptomyces daghestanicus]GHI28588.1 hypothetical protein Sdagh_03180 [Streptomyces daghestanicus]